MNCPKCGFSQAESPECLCCGIVFARYHATARDSDFSLQPAASGASKQAGPFRRFFRIFRWFALVGVILAFYFMLRPSTPPHIAASHEAAKRAEAKIEEFQSSIGQGAEYRLEMDEAELNGWLSENLALKRTTGSGLEQSQASPPSTDQAKPATDDLSAESKALEQLQSSVRDVKIEILEDTVRIYALFDMHGMDLSLELEGRPAVRDGYVRLEPVRGKLGSLPLMAGTLRSVADRVFESPENKEKFRLPPDIRDVRIEQGRLVVVSR
jgi:hypothetical protein